MSQVITVEIPDELAQRARTLAAACHRRLEDAVVEWIDRAVAEPPVEALTDEQLLAVCAATLDAASQEAMSALLARHREGQLTDAEQGQLDQLLTRYRHGLIRKAQALKEAAARNLQPRLDDDAA